MVSSAELIKVIADRLAYYKAKNVVIDPVMVATSGSTLMNTDAVSVLTKELLPLATLVTPNIPEAEILSWQGIHTKEDMLSVAKYIGDSYGCAVLLKGGHSLSDANDLLYSNGQFVVSSIRYADGVQADGTQPLLGAHGFKGDMTNLYFGAWWNNLDGTHGDTWRSSYPGLLDEVRVWKVALTDEEVADLYTKEVTKADRL
jgi:hypothetical protein